MRPFLFLRKERKGTERSFGSQKSPKTRKKNRKERNVPLKERKRTERTEWKRTRCPTLVLFFKSSYRRIGSAARNWIKSVPQTAATTFAFSSVFLLLLWSQATVLICTKRNAGVRLVGVVVGWTAAVSVPTCPIGYTTVLPSSSPQHQARLSMKHHITCFHEIC